MDRKSQGKGSDEGGVRTLYAIPRAREVPPLTDGEILALRRLLIDAERIKDMCPIAQRALSER